MWSVPARQKTGIVFPSFWQYFQQTLNKVLFPSDGKHISCEVSGMKAIILAAGNRDALWPVPTGGTGLGAPLPGGTLLDWNARLLRDAGVSEVIAAVPEHAEIPAQDILPMSVRRFPGGVGELEVLRACAEKLSEHFLVLEDGFLWQGSLRSAIAAHQQGGFALTRVSFRPRDLPSGGVGETAQNHIVSFPAAETGSLGLAICSPALLPRLAGAETQAELLARLRRAGVLGSAECPGRCVPIDSPSALLSAAESLLCARCLPETPRRPGIWSAAPLPEDVELVPPCVIGAGVSLGRGSLIGPHAVVEDGVQVGDHALIQRSILQSGVRVGSRAAVYGAVVCRNALLGSYTVLNEGSAVGPDALIGDNAALMEGVRVGAGEQIAPSLRLTVSQPGGPPPWSVEDMLALGRRLGRCGAAGVGGAGFRGLLLARVFGCGAAAQGAAVVFHDGLLPEQAAWLAGFYRWPVSFFADEQGLVYLFDAHGNTLTIIPPDAESGEGSWDLLAGTASAWTAARERQEIPAQAAFHPFDAQELL